MSKPALFQPINIGPLSLANRIAVSPMCQYSAQEGCLDDWHLIHLGHLALSGAGLLTIEATAVEPAGRITSGDSGLWDDATEAALRRTIDAIRAWSPIPIAIQLAHAGRKASCEVPWAGGAQIPPGDPRGWVTFGPSSIPPNPSDHAPQSLDHAGLERVRDAFAAAARRAAAAGVDAIQLHFAHGYLAHSFLSPMSNRRDDEYGGSLANRMRLPLEIFDAARKVFPADRPITVRVSATDWMEGGWDIAQTISLARALEARGCAAIDVSSGGLHPNQQVPVGPNYQVPLARAVKDAVSIPVMAVGLITEPMQAEAIIATGEADLVSLGRGMLYDPRWPWRAAAELEANIAAPPQYLRAPPHRAGDLLTAYPPR